MKMHAVRGYITVTLQWPNMDSSAGLGCSKPKLLPDLEGIQDVFRQNLVHRCKERVK